MNLFQALQAFDKKSSGYIDVSDFRRLMDNFCFRMTNKQFKHLKGKLSVNADNSMDYTVFLEQFKDPDPEVRIACCLYPYLYSYDHDCGNKKVSYDEQWYEVSQRRLRENG